MPLQPFTTSSSIALPPVPQLTPVAPSCSGPSAAQFHVDKRARTSESEFGGSASVEELFPSTPVTTSSLEDPPLTAITGKVPVGVICIIGYHQLLVCEYTRDPLAGAKQNTAVSGCTAFSRPQSRPLAEYGRSTAASRSSCERAEARRCWKVRSESL